MMKWLYKLEYKHPNWCIPNLMMVIIAGKALVYVAEMFSYNFSSSRNSASISTWCCAARCGGS